MAKKLPVIFVFDMDLTLVGETQPLRDAVALYKFINNSVKIGNIPACSKKLPTTLEYYLKNFPKMLRPNLKDSLKHIEEHYPTAEFFIFSAGEETYVKDVISWVEKQLGREFRRPILTQNNTVQTTTSSYIKSLDLYSNIFRKTLVSDYPAIKDDSTWEKVIANRIIHIDDRTNILWEGSEKHVLCPVYLYKPFVVYNTVLDACILDHPDVVKFIENNKLEHAFFRHDSNRSDDENNMMYHIFFAEKYRELIETNKKAAEDTFFTQFVSAIKKYKNNANPFTPDHVRAICKAVA
jgi:NLI interacting factor-like phosphatase